ncbi:MAG: hypothetical protein NZ733_03055 [Aigarchaeota archaeon]|nr:hypothetical protein [Aigarchaeota archaeon]MCS7126979.1 hypothetical protein [Candidatus Calditenuaceae archaeon]MCX8203673.1 hypothetical protein [Nitrososphaeria archaeon]MDW8043101.1 hypothetical protein [Nitrososphaerota archaeon]
MSGLEGRAKWVGTEQVQARPIVVPIFEGVDPRRAVEVAAEEAAASGQEVLLVAVVRRPKSLPRGFNEYARAEWKGESPWWLYVRLLGEQTLRPHLDYLRSKGIRCDYLVETTESVKYAIADLPVGPSKVVVALPSRRADREFRRLVEVLESLRVPILITP